MSKKQSPVFLKVGVLLFVVFAIAIGGKQKLKGTVAVAEPAAEESSSLVKTCKAHPAADFRGRLAKFQLTDYAGTYAIEVPEAGWAVIRNDDRVRLALTIACLNWHDKGATDGYVISETSHAVLGRVIDGNYW